MIAFPELTYADRCLIKVRVENRAFRFAVWWKVREAKGEGEGNDMVGARFDFSAVFFAEALQMIGNAIPFRRVPRHRGYLDLLMLAKIGFDFLKNGFKLLREDGHGGLLMPEVNDTFLQYAVKMTNLILPVRSNIKLDVGR